MVNSLGIQTNYASVTFFDDYELFTLNYKECFVDVVARVVLSNVKRTPDVPIRLNPLSEEIARH